VAEVSVVIPLYNKSAYVRRTLDSVFAQTCQGFEIFVVDDGSTDGPAIVETYHDPRLHLIRQENAGPGAARNRGIRESSGQYVAFLDADDEWLPSFLERTSNALIEHPECAVVASAYFLGEDRTDVVPVYRGRGVTNGPWNVLSSRGDEDLRHSISLFSSSSVLCRRAVIEKYGGFYDKERCTYGEDYYLWAQVVFNHSIYRLMEPLAWYHTEASGLCGELDCPRCIDPILAEASTLRDNCRPESRPLLDRWLVLCALSRAHELAAAGDIAHATYLYRAFPQMRMFRWESSKLRIKLGVPWLIPFVRRLKTVLGRTQATH
jgi:glycosyltransferase involved in cell wall biosynthesis